MQSSIKAVLTRPYPKSKRYPGKSYKQISEGLKEEYDLEKEPSKATVYEWVRDYTDDATSRMEGHKAQTGGRWVADEMQVDVGGKKMWLWNVMDSRTRYILASHLTPRRDAQAARVVLRKAALVADKPPKSITTDKFRSYIPAVKDVLPEAIHVQSEGILASINKTTCRSGCKGRTGTASRRSGEWIASRPASDTLTAGRSPTISFGAMKACGTRRLESGPG